MQQERCGHTAGDKRLCAFLEVLQGAVASHPRQMLRNEVLGCSMKNMFVGVDRTSSAEHAV